ncbi:MAG: alcohol dehydrogenase catalytic domain-containing protein [Acidobacteriota bacterium]
MPTANTTEEISTAEIRDAVAAPEAETMYAAVYRGQGAISVDAIPVPEIGPGEILIRVEACGICPTDLKKIAYDLLPPPRVYGHETAGVVAKVGAHVTRYAPGDRVIVFHHIPCGTCFYCERNMYAQCPVYKKVGVTAGFEPAGGGFSQYVRVMDWIVERGVEKIPDGVSFDRATFVEPVNTCLKGFKQIDPQPGEVCVILGQGPIGLVFTMMAARLEQMRGDAPTVGNKSTSPGGLRVVVTDTMASRRALALRFGAEAAYDPLDKENPNALRDHVNKITDDRGADLVIVAASAPGIAAQAVACSRPGARILLFAQTSHQERVEISGADICVGERTILGSYSASVDLQAESANLVFSGILPLEELISHRYPLAQVHQGIDRALHPDPLSLKIVIKPQQ